MNRIAFGKADGCLIILQMFKTAPGFYAQASKLEEEYQSNGTSLS